ncbi:tetratricopeptide repeat protein 19 homolog, mitochondrial isoform X2 [Anabrus simplex]|uniref:tetratricopeptide repeat protein 19 homolog, mitochondrial isoform X2 n=1 Tax=Anabrus simplex TaxID=316456 RepID=UPI0035A32918
MGYSPRVNCSMPRSVPSVNTTEHSCNNLKAKTFILCGLLSSLGLKKDDETTPESELIMTIKRSILLIQKEEFKKAEQMLHLALKLAQEQQNSQAVTYIYDLMANLAYDTHAFDKAESLFVPVLSHLLASGTPPDDNKVIHISLKLANIYKAKKDYRKADEGFKFCIENLKNKVDAGASDEDTLLLWAMSLDWYARFELDQGHYKEAFSHFKTAYDMSVQVNGPVSEQNVVLLNDLGTVCCLQNDYDGAIKYLTEAVKIGKSLPDMEDFASIYVNLGAVYLKKQMYEEAKHACEAAWKSAKLHNNKEGLGEASICLDEIKVAQKK